MTPSHPFEPEPPVPSPDERAPAPHEDAVPRADFLGAPHPPPPIHLDEAEIELDRLLRREAASLLRQAAALRLAREELYDAVGSYPLPLQSRSAWLRQEKALRAAAAGGPTPASLWLAWLRLHPISGWPRASRLSLSACRLEDSEFARLCHGHALLGEGRIREAERVFAGLVRRRAPLRHRWRVLEGLALAHELQGRLRLALGAAEAAAAEPHCGVSALAQGLALALRIGDETRARRAAARLDLLVDPRSPTFAAVLARMRRRVSSTRRGARTYHGVGPGRRAQRLLDDLLAAGGSPAGQVARVLG